MLLIPLYVDFVLFGKTNQVSNVNLKTHLNCTHVNT